MLLIICKEKYGYTVCLANKDAFIACLSLEKLDLPIVMLIKLHAESGNTACLAILQLKSAAEDFGKEFSAELLVVRRARCFSSSRVLA